MSDLETPHIGETVHFAAQVPTPNGPAQVCWPALVTAVLPPEAVQGSPVPVHDAVLLEVHKPNGIEHGIAAVRDELRKQPETYHAKHNHSGILPGKMLAGRMNGG